jgi:hypothetical protein
MGSIPLELALDQRKLRTMLGLYGELRTLTVRVRPDTDESWGIAAFQDLSGAMACVHGGLLAPPYSGRKAKKLRVNFLDTSDAMKASSHTLDTMLSQHSKQMASSKAKGEVETIVFFIMSISSFYLAEALGSSGIIGAWICGLATRNWTYHNLTKEGQQDADHFLGIMSAVLTNFVMLWIGLAAYYSGWSCYSSVSLVSLALSMLGRLVSVVLISLVLNILSKHNDISFGHMAMLWTAGIRGPTALCLVYEIPSSLRRDFIATTLFSILVTNVFFGGATATLVKALRIPNARQQYLPQDLKEKSPPPSRSLPSSHRSVVADWCAVAQHLS